MELISTMVFVSLRSGSSGNGYLISDGKTTLMVDAGVTRKAAKAALATHRLPAPSHLFVSHEHSDHVSGLGVLTRAFHPHLVATSGTLGRVTKPEDAVTPLKAGDSLSVGPFAVTLVAMPHDAAEPVGFLIDHPDGAITIISDLGHAPQSIIDAAKQARLLLVESNHDPEMLQCGSYPWFLKRRIASPLGHLSNTQCCALLKQALHQGLETVILGHLSQQNNNASLALRLARDILPAGVNLMVAPRLDELVVRW